MIAASECTWGYPALDFTVKIELLRRPSSKPRQADIANARRDASYIGDFATFDLADEIGKGNGCPYPSRHSPAPAKTQFLEILIDFFFSASARVKRVSNSEVAKRQEGPKTLQMLDGIAARARSLREAMSDIVWTADSREDCLSDLVQRLREVAFTLLETEEGSVEFLAPSDDQLAIQLAPDMRRHLLLFFKEAVTNVARHAEATAVRIEISAAGGRFCMSIRDDGRGFDPLQPRSGRGLNSLQYRAGELSGWRRVESAPSRGTRIELSVSL